MIKYIDGVKVDFFACIDNGKTLVEIDSAIHNLKVYYRHERTWNDHMGNTPCGYYVNAPIKGKIKRIYMF